MYIDVQKEMKKKRFFSYKSNSKNSRPFSQSVCLLPVTNCAKHCNSSFIVVSSNIVQFSQYVCNSCMYAELNPDGFSASGTSPSLRKTTFSESLNLYRNPIIKPFLDLLCSMKSDSNHQMRCYECLGTRYMLTRAT